MAPAGILLCILVPYQLESLAANDLCLVEMPLDHPNSDQIIGPNHGDIDITAPLVDGRAGFRISPAGGG